MRCQGRARATPAVSQVPAMARCSLGAPHPTQAASASVRASHGPNSRMSFTEYGAEVTHLSEDEPSGSGSPLLPTRWDGLPCRRSAFADQRWGPPWSPPLVRRGPRPPPKSTIAMPWKTVLAHSRQAYGSGVLRSALRSYARPGPDNAPPRRPHVAHRSLVACQMCGAGAQQYSSAYVR